MNRIQTKTEITLHFPWDFKDAIKVFLAYLVLMFIGTPIIVRILQAIIGYTVQNNDVGYRTTILFVSLFVNLFLCLYVFYIACVKYHQSITMLGLSLENLSRNIKQGVKRYLITLPLIMLAGFLINAISNYYEITPEMQDVVEWVLSEKSGFVLFSLIFFGSVIAPVFEEIIFRGFLQSALKNSFGKNYAIIISASLFAFVHMDIFAFLQIFILGLLLGYLYERTQTLAASIVVHILHNSLTLMFLLFFKFFSNGKMPVF
ncbi:MAG: CPBP family intramembrane metalloprotease [Candidatus Brocadiaceae bacterium]|nr:CPBP family intramembrane metalloprotease [Candidatus Brocadiaceae bacterium]